MNKKNITQYIRIFAITIFLLSSCAIKGVTEKSVTLTAPDTYGTQKDTNNMAKESWRLFFTDPYLVDLIDTALAHNQELNIMMQEIYQSSNEVQAKKGEYIPQLSLGTEDEVEKVGRYTSQGANDANTDIEPGTEMPDPLPNFMVGGFATWEVDIWRKLRNSKDAAIQRYLASVEGKNFMVTTLVSEISSEYYELLSLDKELALINEYIGIQENALKIVKLQKQAGEVTELAVRKFEAEVLNSKSKQYDIKQEIVEAENHINFLLGRYPQHINRDSQTFDKNLPDTLQTGIPSQLLELRPDIRQAEYKLAAAHLDVKVAKAQFYPSLSLSAGVGFEAFNPAYFVKTPESLLYSLAGDLSAPLINRKALKANYKNANARQIQAVYEYEQTVLNAFVEVVNHMSKIDNLQKSYTLKSQEVEVLNQSIVLANGLFKSAKADYMEVLISQRDALEGRMELIEYKKNQLTSLVNLYRALGGGWK